MEGVLANNVFEKGLGSKIHKEFLTTVKKIIQLKIGKTFKYSYPEKTFKWSVSNMRRCSTSLAMKEM